MRGCQSMSKQILHFELASFLLPKGSSRVVAQVKSSQGVGSTLWAFGTLEEIPGVLGGWVRWWKNCLRKAVGAFRRFLYVAGSLSSGEDVSFWQFLKVFDEFEFRFSSLLIIVITMFFHPEDQDAVARLAEVHQVPQKGFLGVWRQIHFSDRERRSGTFYNKLCWG